MKMELMIYAIFAMVASTFLNAQTPSLAKEHLTSAKVRIEQAGQAYAASQNIKTAVSKKVIVISTEG